MKVSDEDLINSCRLTLIELMTFFPDTFSQEDIRYVSRKMPEYKVISAITTFGEAFERVGISRI